MNEPTSVAAQVQVSPEQAARQQALRDSIKRREALLQRLATVLEREAARETAGDCRDATTTADANTCLADQITTTTANYKEYSDAIRAFLELTHPGADGRVSGPTGMPLSAEEMIKEFDGVEAAWETYHKALCSAAYDQYQGGTIAPSVASRCDLQAIRTHMRELDGTFQPLTR